MEFRPKKRESGLRFGLMWSAVGSAMAMGMLASCSYIIPPDNNPPRYNQVVDGGKRRPVGNNVVGTPRQTIQQQINGSVQHITRAPTGQPQAPLAAPVAPTAQQIAPNNLVSQYPVQPQAPIAAEVPSAPRAEPNWMERNFPATADWLGVSSNPRRPVAPAPGQQGAVYAPIAPAPTSQASAAPFSAGQPETARALAFAPDNAEGVLAPIPETIVQSSQGYQTANNSSYPLLQDTPPTPSNSTQAAQKLQRARQALEEDKRNAGHARERLNHEVQQGESLLEEYGYQPPGQQLPQDGATRPHIPSFDEEFGFAEPAPRPVAPAPLEPIVLRPPQATPASNVDASPKVLHISGAAPRVISGSSNAYLPDSRYANQR